VTALLDVRGLTAGHGRRAVVRDVSFQLAPGEAVALVGPNAAGKSTLVQALAGALPADAGEVRLSGDPVTSLSGAERARRLALVPQSARWELPFTVREVVAMARSTRAGGWRFENADDRRAIDDALDAGDVRSMEDRLFAELSGGERQRVLLARALAQQAPVVLFDEPTAHLDLGHQLDLLDRICAHAVDGGAALVVLHDLAMAARFARVLVLDSGRLVGDGPPLDVLTPQRLRDTWHVDARLERAATGTALLVEWPERRSARSPFEAHSRRRPW
jgi:iron complex transport system ATP-binding protein